MNVKKNNLLSVTALSKAYQGKILFEGVSVSLQPGTSLALVAPSGTGKSTLLSIMGLLLQPSEGHVEIHGLRVDTLSDKVLSRLRRETIGFIFQHTQLIGSLRVKENVMVPARLGSRAPHLAERADMLLNSFQLEDRADYYPHQLSVGQKRRVAAARAFILNPSIIIADEPTNDLDAENASLVVDALFNHVENKGILVFATHDESLARRADTVIDLTRLSQSRL